MRESKRKRKRKNGRLEDSERDWKGEKEIGKGRLKERKRGKGREKERGEEKWKEEEKEGVWTGGGREKDSDGEREEI